MPISRATYESVYRRSYRAVFARAKALTRSEADAHDLTQEAFAALLQAELADERLAVHYLFGTVTKRVISQIRMKGKRGEAWREALRSHVNARPFDDPHEMTAAKQLLEAALESADELTAQIIAHSTIDGMTQGETAEVLGVSRLTVNQRLQAFRAALNAHEAVSS